MVATPREIELAAHYIVDRFGVKVMQEEVEGEGENRVEAAEVRGRGGVCTGPCDKAREENRPQGKDQTSSLCRGNTSK